MLSDREHKRMGESHWKQKHYLKVTNTIKALIAVDVLRSDRLDHEPPVVLYFPEKSQQILPLVFPEDQRQISGIPAGV